MKPVSWVGIVLKVVRHARVETVLQFTELPLSSACDITLDNPGQRWLGNPPPSSRRSGLYSSAESFGDYMEG